MTDIWRPIQGSWAHHDFVRHWFYEGVFSALEKLTWEERPYRLIEFGTREPTSSIMRMFVYLLGDRVQLKAVEYPEWDLERVYQAHDGEYDVVVADQVLEHVERPWLAADEIRRITATGGLAVVCTPFLHPIHPNPLDCWRIAPDGYKVLFPESVWEWVTFGMWGTREILDWILRHPMSRGMTGDWVAVEEAMKSPTYKDESDGLFPIVMYWIGRKK